MEDLMQFIETFLDKNDACDKISGNLRQDYETVIITDVSFEIS